jgi:hypothetical protein
MAISPLYKPLTQLPHADTIDLQDSNSPSAQDHSHKPRASPLGIGPAAPHQASELRHVEQERAAEEDNLSNAWHAAQNVGLSEEPPTDDEETYMNGDHHDQQALQQNGGQSGSGEDETADGESDENMDDDMMDKISSSPSIDDGGYNVSIYPHHGPPSTSSKTKSTLAARPATPLRSNTMDSSEQQDPSGLLDSDGSSPFVDTPTHLPLGLKPSISMRRRPGSPYSGRQLPSSRPNSPCYAEEMPTPPFDSLPPRFPFNPRSSSLGHHHRSEYTVPGIQINSPDEGYDDDLDFSPPVLSTTHNHSSSEHGPSPESGTRSKHLLAPTLPIVKSQSDIELGNQLLPEYDPLLEEEHFTENEEKRPASSHSADGEDGWETESDNSFYENDGCSDFSLEAYTHDDDPDDFPTNPRFIDSGWGGECLRETEDIDFEFVYALHTFVATVEGQANATKGDTMVLLDDSNSYWWLVRVVKDSTIGTSSASTIVSRRVCATYFFDRISPRRAY